MIVDCMRFCGWMFGSLTTLVNIVVYHRGSFVVPNISTTHCALCGNNWNAFAAEDMPRFLVAVHAAPPYAIAK